jgi:hypothetical protein
MSTTSRHAFLVWGVFAWVLTSCVTPARTPAASLSAPSPTSTRPRSSPTHTPATATLAPPAPTPYPPPPTRQPAALTVCTQGCNFTSLRSALAGARAVEGAILELRDPVHIEAGIMVDRDVTIQGAGSDATYLQAAASLGESTDRVLQISPGTTVTVRDLTIRYGHPGASPYAGGGILNEGDLTLIEAVVTENLAADGGGILNRGRLTIFEGSVIGNKADGLGAPEIECGSGGGINNARDAELTMIRSQLASNRAASKGGGLHIACYSLATLIETLAGDNEAQRDGGAIHLGQLGLLRLFGSTIEGNRTHGKGSGIYLRGALEYADSAILGCTIAGEGGYKGRGTVVRLDAPPGTADTQCR